MEVLFVASVSPIVRDRDAAQAFYRDALELTFEGGEGDYRFTEQLDGVKHFGSLPLQLEPEPSPGSRSRPGC